MNAEERLTGRNCGDGVSTSFVTDDATERPRDKFTNDDLIEALLELDDAVPRSIIDECAARGEPMVQALVTLLNNDYDVLNEELRVRPWPRFHVLMILGLSNSDLAGRGLVAALKKAADQQDEFLQSWLAGYWPALLRNKSPACVADHGEPQNSTG